MNGKHWEVNTRQGSEYSQTDETMRNTWRGHECPEGADWLTQGASADKNRWR